MVYSAYTLGESGRIFAIEPVPETRSLLEWNIRKLGIANVSLLPWAASDHAHVVEMVIPRYEVGGENYYQARIADPEPASDLRRISVECRPLDSLADQIAGHLAFIKCDVEGHELACIRGALELTRAKRPAWLIEIGSDPDHPDSDASRVFQILEELEYRAYFYADSRMRPRRPGTRSVNYFFLTREHCERLASLVGE